jgi:dipeptidyl-peptidase-4
VADVEDARRLVVDGSVVTPASLQIRGVVDIDGDTVLFRASEEPSSVGLWTWGADGLASLTPEPGVHSGRLRGGTLIVTRTSLDTDGSNTTVRRAADAGLHDAVVPVAAERPITSLAEPSGLETRITLLTAEGLPTALLLPSWYEPGTTLPVLMDPYGGPHSQRVVAARGAHMTSQWFADQGFAVVVVDGRGTPGRGPALERAVHGDLAGPVLDDQVIALQALAADHPDLDLTRVGIRGWSFGGYLAALAVLRRPDVFHAAVAGAPVTDWSLYDTHYTERYLGLPDSEAYRRSSLIEDAPKLTRPLLLVHGLADDNVRGRSHPAALVRAPRCGTVAQRAAALRRHSHDAAGGRGGEPPAVAGAVPAGQPALTRTPTRWLVCPRRCTCQHTALPSHPQLGVHLARPAGGHDGRGRCRPAPLPPKDRWS